MLFKTPKRTSSTAANASRTAQVSSERRRSGDGWDIFEYSCGEKPKTVLQEFQRGGELATTTGKEPVHDAYGGMKGSAHSLDFSTAVQRGQKWGKEPGLA
jgi:hypothetical protein